MKTDKKSPEFNDELKGQEKNRALRPLIAASLTALSMTGDRSVCFRGFATCSTNSRRYKRDT